MRTAISAILGLLAFPALGQEQQEALRPPQAEPGQPTYDVVAGDRETAWRINRVTGEMVVCRIDSAGSLEAVRARCTPAVIEGAQQTSGAGANRP
jgi:hypothetical protein